MENFYKVILLLVVGASAAVSIGAQICPPSSGCLDPTFFGGGKFTYDAPPANRVRAQDIVVLSDGKFLVLTVAEHESTGFNILRLHNSDGSMDNTFGPNGDGSIYFDWRVNGSTTGGALMMKLQDVDGESRIVLAGVSPLGTNTVALRVERW